MAAKGADVVLSYNSASSAARVKELADRLEKQHEGTFLPVQADVSIGTESTQLVEKVRDFFLERSSGPFTVSIIINNAGMANIASLGSITEEDFLSQYRVNVLGPLLLIQAVLPYLPKDRSARIINVSSTSSATGPVGQTVYASTKAALESMTRTWARELNEQGTVNAINPGPVATDMFLEQDPEFYESLAPMVELTPLAQMSKERDGEQKVKDWSNMHGRPAEPSEVAGIVGMLCSSESGWCTGSVICANGGLHFSR